LSAITSLTHSALYFHHNGVHCRTCLKDDPVRFFTNLVFLFCFATFHLRQRRIHGNSLPGFACNHFYVHYCASLSLSSLFYRLYFISCESTCCACVFGTRLSVVPMGGWVVWLTDMILPVVSSPLYIVCLVFIFYGQFLL
jgi:hypothetical protein